jgi:hypothetical protein
MVWLKKRLHKIQRFYHLDIREVSLLVEAWLTLAWVDLTISVVPYKRWHHWLALESGEGSKNRVSSAEVSCLIQIAEVAARNHLRTMNCLRRSIAQQRMLNRRHISSRIHIGVKKEGDNLAAHAWLTRDDTVLNDSQDVTLRYVELKNGGWDQVKFLATNH